MWLQHKQAGLDMLHSRRNVFRRNGCNFDCSHDWRSGPCLLIAHERGLMLEAGVAFLHGICKRRGTHTKKCAEIHYTQMLRDTHAHIFASTLKARMYSKVLAGASYRRTSRSKSHMNTST